MTAWTDAVQALNPNLWLKLLPQNPEGFTNSGSTAYTWPDDLRTHWTMFDYTDGVFGIPGGIRDNYNGFPFAGLFFTSSVAVSSMTVSFFIRNDGLYVDWNPVLVSLGPTSRTYYADFQNRNLCVYTQPNASSDASRVVTDILLDAILDGSWHMLTMSVGGLGFSFYIDGEPVFQGSIAEASPDIKDIYLFSYGASFSEVVSFHRVLTVAEVKDLWQSAVSTGITPNPPFDWSGQRMALDSDGSIITALVRSGEELEFGVEQKRFMMDESFNTVSVECSVKHRPRITILFPEPRDIFGFLIIGSFGTSTGVTNVVDGVSIGPRTSFSVSRTATDVSSTDWVNVSAMDGPRGFQLGYNSFGAGVERQSSRLFYRWDSAIGKLVSWGGSYVDLRMIRSTDVFSSSDAGVIRHYSDYCIDPKRIAVFPKPIRNVKAIRINLYTYGWDSLGYQGPTGNDNVCVTLQMVHLYGQKSNSDVSVDHSLDIWQEERFAALELKTSSQGDVALRSSQDFRFCVTNRSSRSTARDITVLADALIENNTAPFSSQFMFHSTADLTGRFDRQITIGSLAPGEQSEVLVVRRVTPSFATEGTYIPRILARVGRWD